LLPAGPPRARGAGRRDPGRARDPRAHALTPPRPAPACRAGPEPQGGAVRVLLGALRHGVGARPSADGLLLTGCDMTPAPPTAATIPVDGASVVTKVVRRPRTGRPTPDGPATPGRNGSRHTP